MEREHYRAVPERAVLSWTEITSWGTAGSASGWAEWRPAWWPGDTTGNYRDTTRLLHSTTERSQWGMEIRR